MRHLILMGVLAAGGALATAGPAAANDWRHPHRGPFTTSVTWPSVYPPGWYTSTYYHRWYFPYYAYYDYSTGPYANWAAGGGRATYGYHGPAGYYYYPLPQPAAAPAEPPQMEPPPKKAEPPAKK